MSFTDTPEEEFDVKMTSEVWSAVSEKYQCGDPASCTIDVIKYQSDHPGAKYGMKSAKFAARFGTDVLKEILKDAGVIALKSLIAFSFVGAILGVFFPSLGQLPVNPCTFAESEDWAAVFGNK